MIVLLSFFLQLQDVEFDFLSGRSLNLFSIFLRNWRIIFEAKYFHMLRIKFMNQENSKRLC